VVSFGLGLGVPTPTPTADKYLIEIHSAGTNFFDILQIQGKYQHVCSVGALGGAEDTVAEFEAVVC
jgi:NADPH:quinone reductase-like Zn-dependent oxidoreductase